MLPVSLQKWFQYIGFFVSSYIVLKLTIKLIYNFYVFKIAKPIDFKKYGNWAVITGCTDGIGKAYTEKLAKLGLNVVLISRSAEKLRALSDEIKANYKVETKVIVADFTEENLIYHDIRKGLEDLKIGTLINNVGISYQYPEFFDKLQEVERFTNNIVHCNITSLTKMTAIVLPDMVKRGGGVIVNVSSASGRLPAPLLTIYSATKAYVDFFSRALEVEYKSKGIVIQSLCPYFVSTNMSKLRKRFTVPDAKQYVNSAIRSIGLQSISNGCLVHNFQGWLYESLPTPVYDHFAFKALLGGRKAALRKLQNAQKKE